MAATDIRTALEQQKKQSRPKLSWWQILKETASEWADDDAMTWAAAVSCYTLLALAPMLVVAVKLAAIYYRNDATGKIQTQAVQWMGSAAGDAIKEILTRTQRQGGGLAATVVSFALIVISVGGAFGELQQAMNRIWKVKPSPGRAIWNFVRARLTSVAILAVAAVLLLASVVVAGTIDRFTAELGMGWKFLTYVVDVVVTIGVLTLIFGLMYKTVPDAQIGWGTTAMGALISALLFQLGRYGLALYFKFAAPTSAFGAVGSLAAILIWIYYSAQIVFFGAEFTQVFAKRRGKGVRPSRHAQFLSECDETETPTPSSKPPGQKPPRPDRGPESPPRFADVLEPHSPRPDPVLLSAQNEGWAADRSYVIGAVGLVAGALLGGWGAVKVDRRRNPTAINSKLNRRIVSAQRKLRQIARVGRYVSDPDANQRVDELEREVIATAERARRKARSRVTS